MSDEERMFVGFRIAHALLMVSFVALAYTGFALKYPDAWWARPLGAEVRGWLHRVAAVVMMVALGVHAVHLAVERRARACISGMLPTVDDFREFRARMAYYVGLRKTFRPICKVSTKPVKLILLAAGPVPSES